jgi:ABC-type enterochelin transport system substrate-binding protein
MPLKPHPTYPNKMVYVSRQYDIPQRQGVTHLLNGREIVLAPYNGNMNRIGWLYKDTGLPPTDDDIEQANKNKMLKPSLRRTHDHK